MLSSAIELNVLIVDINECASSPCQNGATCNDVVNGYTCDCAAGYTDTDCTTGNAFFNISCVTMTVVTMFNAGRFISIFSTVVGRLGRQSSNVS